MESVSNNERYDRQNKGDKNRNLGSRLKRGGKVFKKGECGVLSDFA
jgi:hypothetical protein